MAVALDTSVVLRLIVGEPAAQAALARTRLRDAKASAEAVFVTDVVVGETYFALRHHYGMPEREVVLALGAFLDSGLVTPDPSGLSEAVRPAPGVGFMDRLIQSRHRSLDAVTWTFDRRRSRLQGVERLR